MAALLTLGIELTTAHLPWRTNFRIPSREACAAALGISDESLGAEVITSQTAGLPLESDLYVVGVRDSAALGRATTTCPLAVAEFAGSSRAALRRSTLSAQVSQGMEPDA